jgi:AcrR family transcriptional regulator
MKKAARHPSKATVVAEKDRAIVLAAREHFLRDGFAGASMDAIARSAGVSVKTIYSHFENKDELFSKVMIATCSAQVLSGGLPSDESLSERFSWFGDATQRGLMEAGRDYLRHLLSEEQLALYRVVTRDAHRCPELGRRYQENFARGRAGILIAYFRRLARAKGWTKRDSTKDAALYEALLRAGIYEEALHGVLTVSSAVLERHALASSKTMWKLLTADG